MATSRQKTGKQTKSQQLHELAKQVLPCLAPTVYLRGKEYRLRISPRKAEYAGHGEAVRFTGRTTLEACQKMLGWYVDRQYSEPPITKIEQ